MKNDIKEIITEAVLGFLNESAREEKPEDRKKIHLDPHTDTRFGVDIQKKNKINIKIHPKFRKPQSTLHPPGVNESDVKENSEEIDEVHHYTWGNHGRETIVGADADYDDPSPGYMTYQGNKTQSDEYNRAKYLRKQQGPAHAMKQNMIDISARLGLGFDPSDPEGRNRDAKRMKQWRKSRDMVSKLGLEEEPFDENVKKKFLKAIQTKDR